MIKQRPLFGLVIQGPVISTGRHGGTLGTSKKDSVTFDSRENISKYIEICKRLKTPIVVSTWVGQPTSGINCSVLTLDPAEALTKVGEIREPNKYLQAFSTKAGIDYLKAFNPIFVIKVRADLEIDLIPLVKQLEQVPKASSVGYFVPFMEPRKSWSLQDFYFAANFEVADYVWRSYLELPEFHSHVHQDYFWKIGFAIEQMLGRKSPPISFFPVFGRPWTRKQKKFAKNIYELYTPLSKSIWISLTWRGKRISSSGIEHSSEMDFFETREETHDGILTRRAKCALLESAINCFGILLNDWGRWVGFVFRESKLSLPKKVIFKINLAAQDLILNFQKNRKKGDSN